MSSECTNCRYDVTSCPPSSRFISTTPDEGRTSLMCKHPQCSTKQLCSCISQDRCNALFKQVHDEKHLKGRANDAVAAACLYIACRQEEVPRSFKEICAVSRHPKKEIGRCFKLIRMATNTQVNTVSTSDFMVG